ncbi:fumarase fum1, partial [Ceratobasidium sp. 392]
MYSLLSTSRRAVPSLRLFSTTRIMSQEFRTERDTFGDLQVPAGVYWGAQTQR